MKVAYLGPAGSFSESTAQSLFVGKPAEFSMCASLGELQTTLFEKVADMIVMPIFNSKEGALKTTDSEKSYIEIFIEKKMQNSSAFRIVAEKFVPMEFCLLSKKGVDLAHIKKVHVNPYGENLCRDFLSHYPHWQIQKHSSSSAAAVALRDDPQMTSAALSAKQAAEQYDLAILAENILPVSDLPVMHFLVFATGELDAVSVFGPASENLIYVYAIRTEDAEHTLCNLGKSSSQEFYWKKMNEKILYVETVSPLEAGDLVECTFLGTYPACIERSKFQPMMGYQFVPSTQTLRRGQTQ